MSIEKNQYSEQVSWVGDSIKKYLAIICVSVWATLSSTPTSYAQANEQYINEYYPEYNNQNLEDLQREFEMKKEDIMQQVDLFDEYGQKAIQEYNENNFFWNKDITKFEACYRDICIQEKLEEYIYDAKNIQNTKNIVKFFLVRAISLQINSSQDFLKDSRKLKIILSNWNKLQWYLKATY